MQRNQPSPKGFSIKALGTIAETVQLFSELVLGEEKNPKS